jgi:quercetin dioxygenase-like cupin family protein
VATATPTLSAGQTVRNPVSGEHTTFVRTAASTDGHALELRWRVPPGSRMAALPHRHPDDAEEFELLEGRCRYRVGRERHEDSAPHRFIVPPGASHVHPQNIGETDLVLRQWIEADQPRPAMLAGIQAYFESIAALAHAGKVNRIGLILNPLQFALTVSETLMPDSVLSFPPRPVQMPPVKGMAALARRLGMTAYQAPPAELVGTAEPVAATPTKGT